MDDWCGNADHSPPPDMPDEAYWAHEMAEEPEHGDFEPYERLKDVKVEHMVMGLGTIEVYGTYLNGDRAWIMLHVAGPTEVKFLTANDYDED